MNILRMAATLTRSEFFNLLFHIPSRQRGDGRRHQLPLPLTLFPVTSGADGLENTRVAGSLAIFRLLILPLPPGNNHPANNQQDTA